MLTTYKEFKHVGRLRNGFYPLIDFVSQVGEKIAVSLKTINTTSKGWKSRILQALDKWRLSTDPDVVKAAKKILDIRVQKGGMSAPGFAEAAKEITEKYAKIKVKVVFSEIP